MSGADSPSKVGTSDPLREAAALWYDELHREKVSEEARAAFARWQEVPEHRAAYESVARTWDLVRESSHHPHMLQLRHETALRLTRKNFRGRHAGPRIAAAAIFLIIGAALMVWLQPAFDIPARVVELVDRLMPGTRHLYSTALGERLTVTLKDGSEVTLNTQTALETVFDATQRKILLKRGQAIFEVAKDPSRPFVVEAQGQRFMAVGTAFDVRVDGKRVQITMMEGTVRVEPVAQSDGSTKWPSPDQGDLQATGASANVAAPRAAKQLLLTAGEQLTVESDNVQRHRVTDAEHVTSWRSGQVIFENTRLADAVTELNRYSDTKIEIGDPQLAELKLSGAFATGKTAVFIEALTTYFPVEVIHSDQRGIILRARQNRRDEREVR